MKIAIFTTTIFNKLGGSGISNTVLLTAKYLNKMHNNITVFAPLYKDMVEKEVINGVEIKRFPIFQPIKNYYLMHGLKKELEKEKFDLVHSYHYGYQPSSYGFNLSKKINVPHIFTTSFHPHQSNFINSFLFNLYHNVYGKNILKNSSFVLPQNELEESQLLSIQNCRTEIVPCPIDMEFFKNRKRNRKKLIIGYAGILEKWKGALDAFNIFTSLNKKYDDIEFRFIGKGSLENYMKSKIDNNFTFVKDLSNEELSNELSNLDIMVYPTYYESFGRIAAESMACGTPVVSTDTGAMRETVKDGGIVVKREHIAESIISLIENKRNRIQLSKNARKAALNYRADKVSKKVFDIYKEAIL